MKPFIHTLGAIAIIPFVSLQAVGADQDPFSGEAQDPFSDGRSTPLGGQRNKSVDPFADDGAHDAPRNISICYEAFSLPLATAAELQRKNQQDPKLYADMIASVSKGNANQEAFVIIRCRSGQVATSEGTAELTYPTEYEPAELPNTIGVAMSPRPVKGTTPEVPDATKLHQAVPLREIEGIRTPATPTSFDVRNMGTTIEAEALIGADDSIIDLRIRPEHVTSVGRISWGQGFSTCEAPEFEKQTLNSGLTVRVGKPHLLGTMNRPPSSKVNPDSASRVWFAFVTVTLVTP